MPERRRGLETQSVKALVENLCSSEAFDDRSGENQMFFILRNVVLVDRGDAVWYRNVVCARRLTFRAIIECLVWRAVIRSLQPVKSGAVPSTVGRLGFIPHDVPSSTRSLCKISFEVLTRASYLIPVGLVLASKVPG